MMQNFSQSFHSLDDLQSVRVLVLLLVEDARLVEVVDADLPRGVDNTFIVEHHAHMDNLAFFVAEESQVARLDFRQEVHQLALLDLL